MDEKVLVDGIELAMAWGEHFLRPIQARLAAKYPGLDGETLEKANALCQRAMRNGHALVSKCMRDSGGNQKSAFAAFGAELRKDYPWLSDDNLSHLFSQGCYYAWKDGELT